MSRTKINDAITLIMKWWKNGNIRDFPWRRTTDPWKVLIAEVLLVQTDAPKVVKLYEEFLNKYPKPDSLAKAPTSEVAEVLKPLGLYRQRASRLKKLAEELCRKYCGQIPSSIEALKRLPGVSDYIASAVLLFAFGKKVTLLDVNIARILYRIVLGTDPPKRYMYDSIAWRLASLVEWSAEVAYALIDFAAAVCTSKNPKCAVCTIAPLCEYSRGRQLIGLSNTKT